MLCLSWRFLVDKTHISLPCPFKIYPPLKHCCALRIMNHSDHSWSGLLVAVSSCQCCTSRKESKISFVPASENACGIVPKKHLCSLFFCLLWLVCIEEGIARRRANKVIPFIPGAKMHCVEGAPSTKQTWHLLVF